MRWEKGVISRTKERGGREKEEKERERIAELEKEQSQKQKTIKIYSSKEIVLEEIIIVNSAKDDCVIPQEYNAKIIQCNKGKTNASKARNIGATEAKNEILIFCCKSKSYK